MDLPCHNLDRIFYHSWQNQGSERQDSILVPDTADNTLMGDILIVDDLADNLRVLSNMLSGHGYQIRCAKSGAMALMGIRVAPPDLILLDIRMPELDGYGVCQQLKADPQAAGIPVIFLSVLNEDIDKVRALEVGGADYITKPFQIEDVLPRVRNQMTIQRLKKQVAELERQLEQKTP